MPASGMDWDCGWDNPMLAISVDNAAEHFSCAAAFLTPVLPSEKKILCPCTSVLDSVSLDFWINEKAATPHHEWQECFLLLGFAMLCNGFGIQNHAAIRQSKRTIYVRRQSALSIGWHFILPSMCYLIFNLPIPSWVFQNTIVAVPMSRFWANFLVFPVDGNFIRLFFSMGFRDKFIMFKYWVLFICFIDFRF